MKEYRYQVLAFRQKDEAPIQVAFVAHAGEVLNWAGIPRKSDELLSGYQRFLDNSRVDKDLVPFFQHPENCSPTAVIVALRQNASLGSCTLDPPDVGPGEVVPAELVVELDEDRLETDDVFEAALEYVSGRFGTSTETDSEVDEEETEEEDEEEELEEEEESEEEDAPILHLGTVTLQRMRELLEDRDNWSREGFRRAITDYVKPAFLIDGQHRIAAAAKFGQAGLPFMMCGLFDPAWEEQVFQFTVVNLKPKKIPPALITSIAGLSLTRKEQDQVEERLSRAGVRMAEVTIMSLVAYDDQSPFVEKIDMAVGGPSRRPELIGYGSVKRIAKVWYSANRVSLTNIAKQLFQTKSATTARRRWREERAWFDFFTEFWDAVRKAYPSDLWEKSPANRFFLGAHLWAFQEVLLRAADGQVSSHWDVSKYEDQDIREQNLATKLLEVVRQTQAYFPEEMWRIEWAKKSQDTNAGREELVEFFEKFVEEGKKRGKTWRAWKKSAWFEESS